MIMTNERKILCKVVFGSKLYGTDNENSDSDYKGIFLPTLDEILLNRVPKQFSESVKVSDGIKNSSEDIDCEYYSLHYFLELCRKGETVCFDMLNAPDDKTIQTSFEWEHIKKCKDIFITKNMKAFIGYSRSQAEKYSIRGTRLESVNIVYDYLSTLDENTKLKEYRNLLPTPDHVQWIPWENEEFYQVLGKKIQQTLTVLQAKNILKYVIDGYGKRSKQTQKDDGKDWKAISHALRIIDELKELTLTGHITFPLKNAKYIKDVKEGKIKFEDVQKTLDIKMNDVYNCIENSTRPKKIDQEKVDELLLFLLKWYYK